MRRRDFDMVLVGGGLQNGLIALATLRQLPGARLAIVEAGAALGGNHTWSFHAGDVPPAMRAVVEPLVEHRVSSYDVRFPGFARTVPQPYASFTGRRLHDHVSQAMAHAGCAVLLGVRARGVSAHEVTLEDGRALSGDVVVDARGPDTSGVQQRCGFQKFVGLEVAVEPGTSPTAATVMDATVAQTDGFRFVYTLPFGPERCLIEDTYYSDSPHLDRAHLSDGVLRYAASRGVRVRGVLREESGVLPLPWAGAGPRLQTSGPLYAGYQGGWFHPATGYSLPIAVRLAQHVACSDPDTLFGPELARLVADQTRQSRFCHLLNRLLFLAMEPNERWHALARFYRLPDATIERFYALELTRTDRTRILLGRPPKGISMRGVMAALEAR